MSHWLIVVSTSLPRISVKVLLTVRFGWLWSCCVRRGKRIVAFVINVCRPFTFDVKGWSLYQDLPAAASMWLVDCQVIPLIYPRLFKTRQAHCGCRWTNRACSLLVAVDTRRSFECKPRHLFSKDTDSRFTVIMIGKDREVCLCIRLLGNPQREQWRDGALPQREPSSASSSKDYSLNGGRGRYSCLGTKSVDIGVVGSMVQTYIGVVGLMVQTSWWWGMGKLRASVSGCQKILCYKFKSREPEDTSIGHFPFDGK